MTILKADNEFLREYPGIGGRTPIGETVYLYRIDEIL